MEQASTGLVVYRASRLEALLDPLAHLLDTQRPEDVLAPQTVIAAHPGMKHWLFGALARRRGPAGIVANVDIVLPSTWLDELAEHLLGERAVALQPYRREHLRWRIHELLDGVDSEDVRRYLRGDDLARRRFQLADRLARLYTQYLVYRPDWLSAWARGNPPPRDPDLDGGFLAALWRRMRWQIGTPHRGELVARLVAQLGNGGRAPGAGEPLHLFGVSHLAPTELDLLRAVSRQRLLVLYVPDPCRERWAGLSDERRLLREKVRADAFATDTETLFLEQEHPLLAQWGRMGQHFMLALEDSEEFIVEDVRHWQDEAGNAHEVDADPSGGEGRLHRLQESIRRLQPGLLAPAGDAHAERADASLRVHACHTRLRELEVLRDCLLRQLRDTPELKPADIVVMAPDIKAYLPLLPAVFGPPGQFDGPLPYHLADVAVARSHRLFEAFRRVLDLPHTRITAPEVIDLLGVPEIAHRFGLAPGDVELLEQWLRNGRVAWALDAAFRGRLGVPAIAEHTFAWGVDRMLAGYLVGQDGASDFTQLHLPDGGDLAPLDGVHGPRAAVLGALDALLCELADAHADRGRRLRASQWALRLEARVDALFRVDTDDGLARDARTLLLRFVRELGSEPALAGQDPELEFDVVREVLLEKLDGAPERQQFLMGGATFCGMVPQRSIPFGVIAVIGLNEGEFPRGGGNGLDLMQHHRRLGDRDLRNDDRYLFLETVMAARHALHLSYIGEGVQDGRRRNPAAPLGELLDALDRAAGLGPLDADTDGQGSWRRPWLVRHPLQPFDARYFDGGDPALFSHRRDFAGLCGRAADAAASVPFFSPGRATAEAPAVEQPVALRELLAYYRDPARQLLATRLRLRLDALEHDRLVDSEPLEARFEAVDGVARRVFMEALAHDRVLSEAPPAWLRLTGLLPPGRLGDAAWRSEREKVQALLDGCAEHPLLAGGLPQRTPVPVDETLGALRVRGELARCYASGADMWVFDIFPGREEIRLDFKPRIELFVEWALLRLADPFGTRKARLCALVDGRQRDWQDAINGWDAGFMADAARGDHAARELRLADLRHRVGGLLAFWAAAQARPRWYFPKTSWVAATGRGRLEEIWAGGTRRTGERDFAPGYARLLAGDCEFAPGTPDFDELHEVAMRLHELVHFDAAAVCA